MKIYLVACGNKKAPVYECPAKDLYRGDLFQKSRELAELESDRWFILSAFYGLVNPDEVVESYDFSLIGKSKAFRVRWAQGVVNDLIEELGIVPGAKLDDVVILAGENYRGELLGRLVPYARSVSVPLRGLGIGRQLSVLKSRIKAAKEAKNG